MTENTATIASTEAALVGCRRELADTIVMGSRADIARVEKHVSELEATLGRLRLARESLEARVMVERADEMRAGLDDAEQRMRGADARVESAKSQFQSALAAYEAADTALRVAKQVSDSEHARRQNRQMELAKFEASNGAEIAAARHRFEKAAPVAAGA